MGKRHRARECAVQCLYQWDVTGAAIDDLLSGYWEAHPVPEAEVRDFAESLVRGAVRRVEELDARIAERMRHWKADRIGLVEKGILRLGSYELLFEKETPPAVVIDEAVELSKRFCGTEAGQFVNGVLDGIRGRLDEAAVAGRPATPGQGEGNDT